MEAVRIDKRWVKHFYFKGCHHKVAENQCKIDGGTFTFSWISQFVSIDTFTAKKLIDIDKICIVKWRAPYMHINPIFGSVKK